jgi:hypothetical protein
MRILKVLFELERRVPSLNTGVGILTNFPFAVSY